MSTDPADQAVYYAKVKAMAAQHTKVLVVGAVIFAVIFAAGLIYHGGLR